jgi:tripartite-type tricarboxylate transporter receptor subunit TctC
MPSRIRYILTFLITYGILCGASFAGTKEYPVAPIKLVVPFAAGGGGDISARILADATGNLLGQPVIIENRPGAGGLAAAQSVLSAAPDGYTILLIGNINAIAQSMLKSIPYDILRDFAPISIVATTDVVVFVSKSSRFKSLREAVEEAKKKPGTINIGVGLVGTTQHLTAELFKSTTNVDAVIVPFRSSADLVTAVRRGDVDLGFELMAPVLSLFASGDLKALAVSAPKRSPILPEVPTFVENDIAASVTSWALIAGPTGTPEPIVTRLNTAISDALAKPEVRQKFQQLSLEPGGGTPVDARDLLAAEISKWKRVIESAKIGLN